MNPLVFYIPIFVVLMLLEEYFLRRTNLPSYRWKNTLGSLFCGLGQIFIDGLLKTPMLFLYLLVAKWTPFRPIEGNLRWVILILAIDFIYYFKHYLSHKVKLLWLVHAVHHESEDYNFSTGLRSPWFSQAVLFWIPLPLALMGYPVEDYILVVISHSALQIFNHTQLLPKRIRYVEWFLVTPAHHRVHHGKNPQYIDKNFAGVFSFWDYIFGTYEPEKEKVQYGIKGLPERVNPFSSNIMPFFPQYWKDSESVVDENPVSTDFMKLFALLIVTLLYLSLEGQLTFSLKIMACAVMVLILVLYGWFEDHAEMKERFVLHLTTILVKMPY